MTTDSFASGHPGMPQDCAKWERNQINSNNEDYFNDERDAYCKSTPISKRDPTIVCPTFQVPVGTGVGIFGGNGDIVRDNWIYDNWRDGVKLLYVPAEFRGEPEKGIDTSFDNTFADNRMGVRPDGAPDANGNDFWWDEEGRGNCWAGNAGPAGRGATSNVVLGLPGCPGSQVFSPGVPSKTASQATCSTWDPMENPDPPGCDWFTRPAEPPDDGSGSGPGLPIPLASAGGGSGPLVWAGEPLRFTPPTLRGDRILTGRLRNDSAARLKVSLRRVRLLARDGRRVRANPVFLQTFGKTLWSPGRGPVTEPESELRRTGRVAWLEPGDEVPLTVAWHARDGRPATIAYGGGSLQVPG